MKIVHIVPHVKALYKSNTFARIPVEIKHHWKNKAIQAYSQKLAHFNDFLKNGSVSRHSVGSPKTECYTP